MRIVCGSTKNWSMSSNRAKIKCDLKQNLGVKLAGRFGDAAREGREISYTVANGHRRWQAAIYDDNERKGQADAK